MSRTRAATRPAAVVGSLLHNGLQYARVRVEMLEVELGAERERVGAMLRAGALLSLSAMLTVQLLAALVLAYCWNTPWRLPALGALTLAALLATAFAWHALRRLRRRSSQPIAALMRDLERIARTDETT